ncbi:glycine-rich protein, partial [Ruminiclostridium hungatei]|uniref:glycine-rich protein n=1 Tax=Ruminiclostridium hungatei TaxID=48256 RepID=UPI001A990E61
MNMMKKIAVVVAICILFSSIILSANIGGVELRNRANAAAKVERTGMLAYTTNDAYEQAVYTFNYTGNVQNVALKKGRYLFECYGAQGGDNGGGKGGYSKGALYIQSDMTLYIYVGQKGRNAQPYKNSPGGWNGGGSGGTNTDGISSSSGGGASDIRLVNGSWNDSASLKSRIMVAGGGGGGNLYRTDISGGAGGGVSGGIASKFGLTVYGGTQTSGGTGNTNGGLGYGGDGCDSIYGSRITGGGGGGGYYGGGGGIAYSGDIANTYRCSGGAGGSSYISGHTGCNAIDSNGNPTGQPVHSSGLAFTQTEILQGAQAGDGFVKITLLTSPSISITSDENDTFSTNLLLKGMLNNTYSEEIIFKYQIDDGNEKVAMESITSKGTSIEFDITSIDIRALKVGNHTLHLWTSDETGWLSDKLTYNFKKIDALRIIPVNALSTAIEVSIQDNDFLNTQYQLSFNNAYVTEEGTLTSTPMWIRRADNSVTTSAIKIVGLDPRTKYKVQIKARHSDEIYGVAYNTLECETGYSQLQIPRIISYSESSKITLSWVPVPEAAEYEINADGVLSTTSALAFTHSKLQQNTRHTYRVRSRDGENISEWSLPIKVSTKKALPE